MRRPTSVTVFGVLNIVFGGLTFLGLLVSAVLLAAAKVAGARGPIALEVQHSHVYRIWMSISLPLALVAGCVLIAAGIGLLNMKRWAQITSIVYAVYGLAMGLVGIALTFAIWLPAAIEASSRRGPEAAATIGGFVGGIAGGLVGLAYPILLLIFMTRPKVVEAFRSSEEPPVSSP